MEIIKVLRAKIEIEKLRLHNILKQSYSKVFKTMDILIILIFLMNFGAAFITSALVMKEDAADDTINVTLREVNPLMAEVNDYEVHPESSSMVRMILIQLGLWAIIIWGYMFWRNHIYTRKQMFSMFAIVLIYVMLHGMDFFNDFGYLVGGWIWG